MESKHIFVASLLIICILIGMFVFAYLKKTERVNELRMNELILQTKA